MSAEYQLEAVLAFCRRVDEAMGQNAVERILLHPDDSEPFSRLFGDCPEGVTEGIAWHPFLGIVVAESRSIPAGRALFVPRGTLRRGKPPEFEPQFAYQGLARARLVDLPWKANTVAAPDVSKGPPCRGCGCRLHCHGMNSCARCGHCDGFKMFSPSA